MIINIERKKEIQNIVNNLKWRNLFEISNSENIFVFEADLKLLELNPTPSWLIAKTDKWYKILINRECHTHRKRFTFAHELWHFFLHKEILDSQKLITDDDNTLYNRPWYTNLWDKEKEMESEANFFAAELLMPEDVVREAYKRDPSIDKLADFFNVSISAISFRLKNLSIIKNEWWQEEW